MNVAASSSEQPAAAQAVFTRPMDTVARLGLAVAAVGIAVLGYHDLSFDYPWWRALGELAAGCALLNAALRDDSSTKETGLRRWARWGALATCVVLILVGARLQPQPGRELATAVVLIAAVATFFL